eukprot:753564-Hanusia_phi.AAC.2
MTGSLITTPVNLHLQLNQTETTSQTALVLSPKDFSERLLVDAYRPAARRQKQLLLLVQLSAGGSRRGRADKGRVSQLPQVVVWKPHTAHILRRYPARVIPPYDSCRRIRGKPSSPERPLTRKVAEDPSP